MHPTMTGKPRIDHLVPALRIGGVEVAAATAADRADLNCDVRLIFVSEFGARHAGRTILARVLPRPLRNMLAVAGHLRDNPPDLLLASLWKTVPVMAACRFQRNRAPQVFFLHSAREWHFADRFFSRLGMRLADEVWADSTATLEARAVPPGKPTRVVSFVTDRLDAPMPRDPAPRFISWGRLHAAKAYDRAIRFIALLADRGIDAQFDLFGPDGGEETPLRALAATLGIADRVRFHGPVDRARLAEIAVGQAFFLQTSRSEGMCMAAVEGMQLGLVPVATAVGEMAHYVRPDATGIIFDPDRPETAAERVAELLADPTDYRRLSAAARDYWDAEPTYAQDLCRAAGEAIRAGKERRLLKGTGGA